MKESNPKILILNPDTLVDDTYYNESELHFARNVLCKVTEEYCNKWGYDYIRDTEVIDNINDVKGKNRSGWTLSTCNKVLQVKKHLPNYDYVCVLDTYDVLITNMERPLTEFIDDNYSFFIGEDVYHPESPYFMQRINSGWMIFKNDNVSLKILNNYVDCLYELDMDYDDYNDQNLLLCSVNKLTDEEKDKINHADKIKQSYWIYNTPNEQELSNGEYSRMEKLIQSKYLWRPGDFMIHMCGHINRMQLLEKFYNGIYKP
jgi:hypothetical protein